MKILHLSKFYPPDPGGLEQVVGRLAEGAAAAGHEVRVVAATGSSWLRDPRKRVTESPRMGVGVVRLPTYGVWWSQPLARGYVSASRWPADVVYVHRPHPLADLAALMGPRRPLIVFHHSDVQRQQLARLVYQPLARAVARRAAASVVATRAHLDHAADLGRAGRAKAVVIPFGVDERVFAPSTEPERPVVFPTSVHGPVGLFVGRLVGYKGLDVLLRALAGTSLRVVIVGGGPLQDRLEQDIERLGVSDRALLVGEVSDAELVGYYRAADYFVLPSTTPAEMFGICLIEAMACGTPVISTALTTGVKEVNERDVTGLVVAPGDHLALRAAMEKLAGDAALRGRLGEAARRRVEERFTLRRMIDSHLELCEELAG